MKVVVFKPSNSQNLRSVGITNMYPDDFEAFIKLMQNSGIPQFEAVAQSIKDKEAKDA